MRRAPFSVGSYRRMIFWRVNYPGLITTCHIIECHEPFVSQHLNFSSRSYVVKNNLEFLSWDILYRLGWLKCNWWGYTFKPLSKILAFLTEKCSHMWNTSKSRVETWESSTWKTRLTPTRATQRAGLLVLCWWRWWWATIFYGDLSTHSRFAMAFDPGVSDFL